MVALTESTYRMTPEAFLEWELTQELRYEYVNGEIVAMTGGTIPHNDLALNLYRRLYEHVKSRGCRINVSDVKVKIRRYFRYPDLVVTCDDRDKEATKLFQYPKLIVEVLSPSTESTDRGKKLQEYQSISTLEEYVLIDSDNIRVEIYRRSEGRLWFYESFGPGESLNLESLDLTCAIDAIYEDVTLPPEADESDEETE